MPTQNNYLITACITHFNDADFVLNTLYCLKHLTKNPYKVIIRDNNSKKRNYQKLAKAIKAYDNVELYRAEGFNLKGSMAHGTAINDLVSRIDTPYGAIFDADCAFLIKNWDEILKGLLNDKVKMAGTQAPAGAVKPMDFPLIFAVLFETEILKKLNIDFRPKDLSMVQDSGWEVREKFFENGYQGELLIVKNTRTYRDGPFGHLVGIEEYYLPGINHIFACHFGRGSTLGSAKYKKGQGLIFNIPFLGRFFRQLKGRREKKKWIDICHKIVSTQQTL